MKKGKFLAITRQSTPRGKSRSIVILAALFLQLSFATLQAQESPFHILWQIPVEARFFTTDKLQQVYLVTPDNEVIKYSARGEELFRYNNNTLGPLAHIDATNPFNLLLYYPDFQVAITLDRTMSQIGEFNMWNLPLGNVQTVAMARDNSLWVYDNAAFQLVRVDQKGNVLAKSDNLNQLLNLSPEPETLLSRDNLIYANDPELGILIFDDFGQFVRTLPLTGLKDMQVFERRLVGQENGSLLLFNLETLSEQRFLPPDIGSSPLQMEMQKDRLYILGENTLGVYQLK